MRYLMATKLNSRHLNKSIGLCVFLTLAPVVLWAQMVVEKNVTGPRVTSQSVDRRNNFYLAYQNGTVAKYDTVGNEIVNFSPTRLGQVSLLDAWNPLKTFLFYEEFQSIVVLDRFMAPTSEYDLTGKSQSFIRLACPSQDNSFWLVDDSYNGLLKFDPIEQKIQSRIPFNASMPLNGKILFIREYQNVLFALLQGGGVAYFDNLGSYQGTIDTPAASYFSFNKNQMYLTVNDYIVFKDLYADVTTETQLPGSYENCLIVNDKVVGIKKEGGFDLLH